MAQVVPADVLSSAAVCDRDPVLEANRQLAEETAGRDVMRALSLPSPKATWLTFRRTYSSWSHEIGVPWKGEFESFMIKGISVQPRITAVALRVSDVVKNILSPGGSDPFRFHP